MRHRMTSIAGKTSSWAGRWLVATARSSITKPRRRLSVSAAAVRYPLALTNWYGGGLRLRSAKPLHPIGIRPFTSTTGSGGRDVMSSTRDRILLKGLTFHGFHGAFDAEQRLGQKFVVDAELHCDLRKPAESDDLMHTIDYGQVFNTIKTVSSYSLLLSPPPPLHPSTPPHALFNPCVCVCRSYHMTITDSGGRSQFVGRNSGKSNRSHDLTALYGCTDCTDCITRS